MADVANQSMSSQASNTAPTKRAQEKQKTKQILGIVNQIFKKNSVAPVTNLSQDFADGHLFLKLFNILFDETVELRLSTDSALEARINNWNKINCVICFNYFQQQFILIGSTMKALAQGKKNAAAKAILCLIECTLGTQFESFLDTSVLRSIADVVSFEVQFDQQDKIDLQTDEKLNQFEEDKQDQVSQPPPQSIPANQSEEDAQTNEMDFSFQRPKKQKKVCIVEEDIKMTKDEIEIYNQMRDEAAEENAEHERQAAQLFQEQQSREPDLGNQASQARAAPLQSQAPSTTAQQFKPILKQSSATQARPGRAGVAKKGGAR